jgi:hypothetical protein
VPLNVTLRIDGQVVEGSATIATIANYLIEVDAGVSIPGDSVSVSIDDEPVAGAVLFYPDPEDSTIGLIRFNRSLSEGPHELAVRAGSANVFRYDLMVSLAPGLRHVINYPNPFTESTSFVFENDVEINEGRIDIYTVSGKRVRRLVVPSSPPGRNTVYWDGRDQAGGAIANGVYLYVISVTQRGQSSTIRGKLARIE